MEDKTSTTVEANEQQPPPAAAAALPTASSAADAAEDKWGTKHMGPPAAPSAHPHNQRAATWLAAHDDVPGPYRLGHAPVEKPSSSPMETILDLFNTWTRKAETLASNVWLNLKTAPSKTEAAWGKLGLAAKAITEGGFESIYRQTFPTDPNEKLKKTFACYLSTTTGPVAGTLYLSNLNVAFCSDRPLSFTAPSGQEAWSYYKVIIPLAKVARVVPVTMKETPPGEVHPDHDGRRPRLLVHGFCELREGVHASVGSGLKHSGVAGVQLNQSLSSAILRRSGGRRLILWSSSELETRVCLF